MHTLNRPSTDILTIIQSLTRINCFLVFWVNLVSFEIREFMKLTGRQEYFIICLLDLYRMTGGPIHYSTLAERVGVSPFTAYDMLQNLKEKGFVTSSYRLEQEGKTVGRSEVVFSPTQLAYKRFADLETRTNFFDWEVLRIQIEKKILAGDVQSHELADELIARIPKDSPDSLRYCFAIITLLILRLYKNTGRLILVERMPQILRLKETFTKSGLLILGGFILGFLATEDYLILEKEPAILEYVQLYQSLVSEMEPRVVDRLAKSINDIFTTVLKI